MGFRAEEVTPKRWRNIRVLFDNGVYSVVAGIYRRKTDETEGERLGERWNGQEGQLGFPNQAGKPIYHAVPAFLERPVLHGVLDELARRLEIPQRDQYMQRTLEELARLSGP